MQKNAGFNKKITSYAAALSLLVVWEVLVRIYDMPAYILPGPFRIIKTLAANYDLLAMHTLVTLQEAMLGFAIAAVIALAAGFVLNQIAWLNESIYPLLIVSQSIPIITLAPLFLIWFGWGILPKIIVVVLVCVFPMIISFLEGLNAVDPDLINLFRSMGASRLQTFMMVKVPAALPTMFAGFKISASYGIMAAVIGEWLGAQQGLGFYMTISQKSFLVDRVLAAVVIIAVLSLLIVKIIDVLEWLLTPWHRVGQEWNE